MFPVSTLRTAYAPAAVPQPSPLLPLAGGLAGLVGLGAYWLGTVLFPPPYLPVLLCLAAVAGLTLARPESGFATLAGDPATPPGGTVWLLLLVLARLFALQALFAGEAFGPAVALKVGMAHSLSHLLALSVSWSLPPAGQPATVRPAVMGRAGAVLIGLLPLLALTVLTTLWIYALFLLPLLLLRGGLIRWFRRSTGGYTGACLGTAQQLGELLIYLSFVSLLWISV